MTRIREYSYLTYDNAKLYFFSWQVSPCNFNLSRNVRKLYSMEVCSFIRNVVGLRVRCINTIYWKETSHNLLGGFKNLSGIREIVWFLRISDPLTYPRFHCRTCFPGNVYGIRLHLLSNKRLVLLFANQTVLSVWNSFETGSRAVTHYFQIITFKFIVKIAGWILLI